MKKCKDKFYDFDLTAEEQQKLANEFNNLVDSNTLAIYDVSTGLCDNAVDLGLAQSINHMVDRGEIGCVPKDNDEAGDYTQLIRNSLNIEFHNNTANLVLGDKIIKTVDIPVDASINKVGVSDLIEEGDEFESSDDEDSNDKVTTAILPTFNLSYDDVSNIVTVNDSTNIYTINLNKLDRFKNEAIYADVDVIENMMSDFIRKMLPTFKPAAVFRKSDFETMIGNLISDYDKTKYYIYRVNQYVICYIVDDASLLAIDDILNDACDMEVIFSLLYYIETFQRMEIYKNDLSVKTLSALLMSDDNQSSEFVNDILGDKLTDFSGMLNNEDLLIDRNQQSNTLALYDKIKEKMYPSNQVSESIETVKEQEKPEDKKPGITRIESDSSGK